MDKNWPAAYFKKTLQFFPTLILAFVVVSTVAYAQSTFTEPTTAAPGANVSLPINAGATYQEKSGAITASAGVGSTNGYTLQGAGTATSPWDFEYSTTNLNSTQLTTFNTQQICIGSTCISSLGSIVPAKDIYLNGASCYGDACGASTALEVCIDNGYSHVANEILNGNGNNGLCTYSNGNWACGGSCSTSCGSDGLQRVTCDDNS